MNDTIFLILIVLAFFIWLMIRVQKRNRNFRDVIPNFISFCNSNGMELVGESSSSMIYRKPIDYIKLGKAYSLLYEKDIDLPSDIVLYQYIGISCNGGVPAISSDYKKPTKETGFYITNYIITEGYKPNIEKNKSYLSAWKDEEVYYQELIERGYRDLAIQIKSEIEDAKTNKFGWYSNILKNEDLKQWHELSGDIEIPAEYREIIKIYFIPYRISSVKFIVNKDGTSDPYRYFLYENESLFSPTLREFQKDPSLKSTYFPSWFYQAFPDVIMWTIKSPGNIKTKELLENLTENEVLLNNQIRHELLKKIIDLYLSNTLKKLEVSVDT